jgi:hypothetical protein
MTLNYDIDLLETINNFLICARLNSCRTINLLSVLYSTSTIKGQIRVFLKTIFDTVAQVFGKFFFLQNNEDR